MRLACVVTFLLLGTWSASPPSRVVPGPGLREPRGSGSLAMARMWWALSPRGMSLSAAEQVASGPSEPTGNPADRYESEGYALVWSDEFDTPGKPDPNKWTYEVGFSRNAELQWYQPDNARCENGLLVIEARREQKKNPNYREGSTDWRRSRESAEYTSAALITRGLHDWQYGRFEMRARIDTRAGLWPAWWTLGVRGSWPAGGEVDIMEYYRGILLANVAWAERSKTGKGLAARWDDVKVPLDKMGDSTWSQQYHVWRMDWDENRIELSVDGRVLNTTDLSEAMNPEGILPREPFRQPHYMLVNLAIGGTQGGDASQTQFPARYEVDYIRVYQKQ